MDRDRVRDTAGQEEYKAIRPMSYDNTDVFLVVFSVAHPPSFENTLTKWLPELQTASPTSPKIVVGNKIDLRLDTQPTAANISKYIFRETVMLLLVDDSRPVIVGEEEDRRSWA
jgi:small GTP-binding protein